MGRSACSCCLPTPSPGATIAELESRGHTCVVEPSLGGSDLAGRIGGFDVLVVRSTKVGAAVFEAADRLALVIRAGAGTNTIDTAAAAARGVLVANVPGRNAAAVAELTMGLLLAIDRRIADNVADLRRGRWDKKTYGKADGLLGSTLGIIGLGSIGLCVAERAAAFGIRVQALARPGRRPDVAARAEELGITFCDTLPELLATSDIVSLHVPAHADTKRPGRRRVPRPDADRRDPAQHLARRRRRRGGAAAGARRGPGPGRPGRVRRRAGLRIARLGLAAVAQHPAVVGDPPHRRVHRAGPARDRRRRGRDRRRVRHRRQPALREPRPRAGSGRRP